MAYSADNEEEIIECQFPEVRIARLERAILKTGLKVCEECLEYVDSGKQVRKLNSTDIFFVCTHCEHKLGTKGLLK